MQELLFYTTIDEKYIKYFVPLYSYKKHYKKYKSNFSFLFIYDRKNTPLAIIKFSAMILVPKEVNVVHLLKYEEKDKKYKNLISSGYRYINSNRQEINVRELKSYYTDHSF